MAFFKVFIYGVVKKFIRESFGFLIDSIFFIVFQSYKIKVC